MTFTLISNVGAASPVLTTTPAIDTTGANLIVVTIASSGWDIGQLSDSNVNNWTLAVAESPAQFDPGSYIAYCVNPIVGAGHTFSTTASPGVAPAFQVTAWSGSDASPLDQTNHAVDSTGPSYSPGSITPSLDGELIITSFAVAGNGATVFSIDGSYTISDFAGFTNGVNYGGAQAYWVQTAATATNPAWGINAGVVGALTIASFMTAGQAIMGAMVM